MGLTWRKPLSLRLQHTYLEVMGSNPVTGKNFFGTKFNCLHEGMRPMLKRTFLSHFLHIQLARCSIESSFLLILLSLESLSKLFTPTWIPTDFSIFLFYLSTNKLCLSNSQFDQALGTLFPTTSIRNYSVSSALIVLRSFGVLGR